jgi:gas vesicle protein
LVRRRPVSGEKWKGGMRMDISKKAKERIDDASKELKEAIEGLKREVAGFTEKIKGKLKGTGEEMQQSVEEVSKELKNLSEKAKDLITKKKGRSDVPVGVDKHPEFRPETLERPFMELSTGVLTCHARWMQIKSMPLSAMAC